MSIDTVPGFRFVTHVRGLHAANKDIVSIQVPSFNLSIDDKGNVQRSVCMVANELMQQRNNSDAEVQLPTAQVEHLNSLVKLKENSDCIITEFTAAIKKKVQEVFDSGFSLEFITDPTVEGSLFIVEWSGFANESYDTINIHIPSLELEIASNGGARKAHAPTLSKVALNAMNGYIQECHQKRKACDAKEMERLVKKQDEGNVSVVLVSQPLVREIASLVAERNRVLVLVKQKDLHIAELAKQLISSQLL